MIKCYRLKRNLTQEELAEIIGRDVRTIQRIENGEKEPTMKIFKMLVKILNIEDKDIINYIKK